MLLLIKAFQHLDEDAVTGNDVNIQMYTAMRISSWNYGPHGDCTSAISGEGHNPEAK